MRWASGAASAAAWLGSAVFVAALWMFTPEVAKPATDSALVIAIALVPLVLSIVLARRAPGHPAGPLLALAGFFAIATNLIVDSAIGPWEGGWMLLYLAFAILLLIVPNGRVASRRWLAVGWVLVTVVAAFMGLVALQWFVPSTVGPTIVPAFVLLGAFFVLLVACATAPIARYRRADEGDRMRLRWIFLAGTSLPVTLLLCWTSYVIVGTADLVGFGLVLMYVAIPIGVTIAIVRPALLDIDRATVATATATSLAVAMLLVLSVACGFAGTALVRWSPVASISTVAGLFAAAVLLFPLVQRALDRLLYPERGRAIAALAQLTTRVESGTAIPAEVQHVLRTALRDPGLLVAYRGLTDHRLLRLDDGPASITDTSTAVHARGEEIGAIIASAEHAKRPAAAVARAASPLIDAVRTEAVIAGARFEVEASRERLLLAGYEERRRLERDLHDGAQQRLVALGMQLRVLQRTQRTDTATAVALDAAVAELGTAVAELRQIAQGVRPSALDEGLGPALADLTRTSRDIVELHVEDLELPDAVATTAYYVVSEAVANALRHAEASWILVSAREHHGTLHVRVDDNGRGGAVLTPTGGLTGLADRVAALGGELEVGSRPGAGTRIEARMPCAS